jgi:hypothetical protein
MTSTTWTQTAGMDSGTNSDTVLTYAESALAAADAAAASQAAAAGSAAAAAVSDGSAAGYATLASASADTATAAASSASASATAASGYAGTSSTNAANAASAAYSSSVDAAATAADVLAAAASAAAAAGSEATALGAAGDASTYSGAAYTYMTTSSAAATNAAASQVAAGLSETAAAASEIAADGSANAAASSELAAAGSASASAASAVASAASETAAALSAGEAAGSAVTANANISTAVSAATSALGYSNSAAASAASASATATALTGFDLAAIAASKAITAVDGFVYDTSKDSDGGAWRKRCQHTSWYNETLNTATRGSRREFPAVAVIVIAGGGAPKVTIYDGDDPSLPLWRECSAGLPNYSGTVVTSVKMLNGKLFVGVSVGYTGYLLLDFASDYWSWNGVGQGGNGAGKFVGIIGNPLLSDPGVQTTGLQGTTYTSGIYTYPSLVSMTINDIAMTVLPDAPIDPATGLQVPTIAVATAGGVSVIKDDGTVVDIVYSGSPVTTSVDMTPERMFFSATNGVVFASGYPISDISNSSFSTLAGLLPNGAGYYSTTIPAVLGTISKVAA